MGRAREKQMTEQLKFKMKTSSISIIIFKTQQVIVRDGNTCYVLVISNKT